MKDSITLYFKSGSADKVYFCEVIKQGAGFVVNFAFGRRGTTMQTGTKTNSPITYEKASDIFNKLIKSKKAKGYTEGVDNAPYVGTMYGKRVTNIHCQLLNPITEDRVEELIYDNNYGAQEKFDGKRMIIQKVGDKVIAINRKGLECGFPEEFKTDALTILWENNIQGDFIIDGEAVGDKFYAFDLLSCDGVEKQKRTYNERYFMLSEILTGTKLKNFVLAPLVKTEKDKIKLIKILKKSGKEGIVFKRLDAPYVAGRPASGGSQLKFKFVTTASCIVAEHNSTKRSVALELIDENNKRIFVGNCAITPNKEMPKVDAVVEIRYLYVTAKDGALYQPVYLGERTDIDKTECVISQLKYKKIDIED